MTISDSPALRPLRSGHGTAVAWPRFRYGSTSPSNDAKSAPCGSTTPAMLPSGIGNGPKRAAPPSPTTRATAASVGYSHAELNDTHASQQTARRRHRHTPKTPLAHNADDTLTRAALITGCSKGDSVRGYEGACNGHGTSMAHPPPSEGVRRRRRTLADQPRRSKGVRRRPAEPDFQAGHAGSIPVAPRTCCCTAWSVTHPAFDCSSLWVTTNSVPCPSHCSSLPRASPSIQTSSPPEPKRSSHRSASSGFRTPDTLSS